MKMSLSDRIRFFIRSFAIQGSWNFPQMQGLGFFYILAPWLRKVTKDQFQEASRRHLGYFNTHPYMASYIFGAVARLEEDGNVDESIKVSANMMGPLGAVGDTFFWARFRPAAILLAVAVSFFWPAAAAPVLLLTFNFVHIRERWSGIGCGYLKADDPMDGFTLIKNRFYKGHLQHLIMGGCGFILGAGAFRTDAPVPVMVLFFLGYSLFRFRQKTLIVIASLVVAGLVLGMSGVRIGLPWSVSS